jgi:Isoprenylcysteine carboxyl methyltransferase (ICMT) family
MRIGPVAEQRGAQKVISALFMLGFLTFVVLPAFDHRFGWSPVAPIVSIIADGVIALSFVLFFLVMKSNSYAASTIQVEEAQPVVSTGPYAHVRHPMYSGALLLVAAMSARARFLVGRSPRRAVLFGTHGGSLMRKTFSGKIWQDIPSICSGYELANAEHPTTILAVGLSKWCRRATGFAVRIRCSAERRLPCAISGPSI